MEGTPRPYLLALVVDALLGAAYAVAAAAALQRARHHAEERAGWRLFGGAAAILAVAQGLLVLAALRTGSASEQQEPALWLSSLANPVLASAVLAWPGAPRGRGVRMRLLLDGVVAAGSLFFMAWLSGLGASVRALQGSPAAFAATVYSIVIGVAALAVCGLLASRDPGRLRGPLGWLAACLGTSIVADVVGATLALRGDAFYWGHAVDLLQLVPALCLLACPLSPAPMAGRPWDEDDVATASSGATPYVPVLAALALALVHGAWLADRWDAVQTTTAMTVVMALVLRQFLALRDLRDLSHTLEERVRSRTRALEESQVALVRSQRLDAVGRMAAGIAHDFNNLLTIITAAVDYARLAPGDSPAPPPVLEEVEGAARRGTELVRQLLAFARRQPRKPRVFELLPALREVAPLLARLLGPEHQLVVATSGAGLFVEADPGQLEQVLVNLVTNARDAMTAGGTVRITVDREEAAGAEWVACAVQDTGAGLSAEAMAHLFEPFFTTKGARGTGLGLSSCYGIVSAAGGRIEVESEAGAGTTFRVLLPRAFAAREVPSTREAV